MGRARPGFRAVGGKKATPSSHVHFRGGRTVHPVRGVRSDAVPDRERQLGFFALEPVEADVDVVEAELGSTAARFGIADSPRRRRH